MNILRGLLEALLISANSPRYLWKIMDRGSIFNPPTKDNFGADGSELKTDNIDVLIQI